MIRSLLLGAVAGSRSMTPLAAVSVAAASGALPRNTGAPAILSRPGVAAATIALALGELGGDKMKSAPDRIVAAGLLARVTTGAIAGMSLAPANRRLAGAALGAAAAVVASFPTFQARIAAMRRYGQTSTGLIEDALVLSSAYAIVKGARTAR